MGDKNFSNFYLPLNKPLRHWPRTAFLFALLGLAAYYKLSSGEPVVNWYDFLARSHVYGPTTSTFAFIVVVGLASYLSGCITAWITAAITRTVKKSAMIDWLGYGVAILSLYPYAHLFFFSLR